jgi:hypothetical protein
MLYTCFSSTSQLRYHIIHPRHDIQAHLRLALATLHVLISEESRCTADEDDCVDAESQAASVGLRCGGGAGAAADFGLGVAFL